MRLLTVLALLFSLASCRLSEGNSETLNADALGACTTTSFTFPTQGAGSGGGVIGSTINAVDGTTLSGVTVKLIPQSALVRTQTFTTDASGNFQTGALTSGSYVVQFTLDGYISCVVPASVGGQDFVANCALSPVLADGQFRMVLTWTGPKTGGVADIDSYLEVPGDSMPVFYGRRSGTGASLDQDRTNWYGPETVTITAEQPGTYIYYYNNYSDRSDLAALSNSEAIVTLYAGSKCVKQYPIRTGSGTTYEVFHITNGVVSDVEAFNDSLTVF